MSEALGREELRQLRIELVAAFQAPPRTFLVDIGLPANAWPPAGTEPADAWLHVLQQIGAGALPDYRPLLTEALRLYPANEVFAELAARYEPPEPPTEPPTGREPIPDPARGAEPPLAYGVRPNIQVSTEEERRKILDRLHRLEPTRRLATNFTMLVEFATADEGRVFRELDELPSDVIWTVVAPGQPAYLLSHLTVRGPDGRLFRVGDIPASTLVEDLTASALEEYPSPTGTRAAVADRVLPNGQGQRLRPDQSLHEANVRDGDEFRVGYETNAGAVNPLQRTAALTRVRNQLRDFAESRGWGLVANAPELPTVYDLSFARPSFGPPPPPAGPQVVDEHTVQVELGPDFPQSAPSVYWLTPIFHPNIYPNYECEESRTNPALQGYVCLGELEEGYQPGLDLGELCLTLIDIAGYRNYSLQIPTNTVVRSGAGLVVAGTGNALDVRAARWVRDNQHRLAEIGGRPLEPVETDRPRRPYRHLVEPLDR
jgi:hypothetical protein